MKNTYFILFSVALLIFSSCENLLNKEILVDNSGFSTLTITIDGRTHEIAGYTTKKLELPRGEHDILAVIEGETIFDSIIEFDEDGLLNVLGETYVVWHDLYLAEGEEYETHASTALENKDVRIGDKLYEDVDFEVYTDAVFIPKNWDFSIEEEWAVELDFTEKYVVKGKIYRLHDLEESWGFYGDYDFSDRTDEDLDLFLDSISNELKNDSTNIDEAL